MEQWKEITWTNGRYYVSDEGRVMSRGGRKKKPHSEDGIMRPIVKPNGYAKVNLFVNRKYYTCHVHNLVMSAFVGDSEGRDVNHKNGNKLDNRLCNLEYCTRKENMAHCSHNGLRKDIIKVAAVKNGVVVASGDFSRELAEKLKPLTGSEASVETIARSIRQRIGKNKPYLGFTYIRV